MKLFKQKRLRRVLSLAFAFTLVFTLAMSASASTPFGRYGENDLHYADCCAEFTLADDGYISQVKTVVNVYLTDYGLTGDIEEETFEITVYVQPYGPNNQEYNAMQQYDGDVMVCFDEEEPENSCEMEFVFPSDMDVKAVEVRFSVLNQVRDEYIYIIPLLVYHYQVT